MEKFITFLRRIDGIGFLLMLIGFFGAYLITPAIMDITRKQNSSCQF